MQTPPPEKSDGFLLNPLLLLFSISIFLVTNSRIRWYPHLTADIAPVRTIFNRSDRELLTFIPHRSLYSLMAVHNIGRGFAADTGSFRKCLHHQIAQSSGQVCVFIHFHVSDLFASLAFRRPIKFHHPHPNVFCNLQLNQINSQYLINCSTQSRIFAYLARNVRNPVSSTSRTSQTRRRAACPDSFD